MRATLWLLPSFVFLLLSIFCCSPGLGCGCIPRESLSIYELVKQSVDHTDAVFLGIPTVLYGDGKSEETQDLVVFDVLETFKGKSVAQVGVHSGVGTTEMSSCGYSFEIGETYLVFANQYSGHLVVAPCSFTRPLEDSGTALRLLRKEPPVPDNLLTFVQLEGNSKGRISGVIRRSDSAPLHEPRVYVWDDLDASYQKEALFVRADEEGAFESDFLSPGTYRITAVDPSDGPTRWVGAYTLRVDDTNPATVQVFAGRNLSSVDIVLHQQKVFSIHGVIRSSDGSPLPFKHVEIKATMTPSEMFSFLDFVSPDASGKFAIERVPVGKVRLNTYVSEFVDPNWEPCIKELEVNGDTNEVEIVLTRKAGPPAPVTPTLDDED